MKKDRLILLRRRNPYEWEIHRNEINNTANLLLTFTEKDREFAENLVEAYNKHMEWLEEENDEWVNYEKKFGE